MKKLTLKRLIATFGIALSILGICSGHKAAAQADQTRGERLRRFLDARAARSQNGNQSSSEGQSYTLLANQAYGPAPLEKLDVYTPKNLSAPAPILFFVHGGGWSNGDKSQKDHAAKGEAYTSNGVVFVSVDYGLAPQVMHPKQVQDIADAFAWVKSHAAQFGGDSKRIFLMGHSAGAQLVDLFATNDRFIQAKGLNLSDIQGVISLDTASLDLATRINDGSMESRAIAPMIKAAFGTDPKVLADGSPYAAIHAGQHYPPFLMYCGLQRKPCMAQHRQFEEAMKKAGGQVNVQPVNLSHRDINLQAGEPDSEIFKSVLAMIKGR